MRRLFTVALAAVLLLTGCTATAGPAHTPTRTASPAPTAEDVVASIDSTFSSAIIHVGVHPIVRVAQGLVLTLTLTADDPDERMQFGPTYPLQVQSQASQFLHVPMYAGLRLVDLHHDQVMTPAVDEKGEAVAVGWDAGTVHSTAADDSESVQILYGDNDADELSVFVPQAGLVSGIPVIDGKAPDPHLETTFDDPVTLDPTTVSAAPVYPLTSYSVDTSDQTRVSQETHKTTIALASDVLFAFDSASLSDRAKAVIARAAATLKTHEPGEVAVTGFTDDVDTAAYNLTLSKKRAQSVADALKGQIDTEKYPLKVTGRGEADPVADNSTKDGRALNRRVELTITTATEGEAAASATELPKITGPVATGAKGVDIDNHPRKIHISSPGARMVDGHLVVTMEVTATDDDVDSAFGISLDGMFLSPGISRLRSAAGIAVMNGPEATLPALHTASEASSDERVGLTDLMTLGRLDGGDTRRFDLVYPRSLHVGKTVTVQLLKNEFRLTDIPVEQG